MNKQKEPTTDSAESKRITQPRAQLKHALIRVNFMNLAKVRALKRLYGLTSKLALIEIYLTMSCATNAVISKEAILDIAEENEVKDAEGFLDYCLEEGLIQLEGKGFTNSVVIEDQEQYAKKLKRKPDESEIFPDSTGKNRRKFPEKSGKNLGEFPAKTGLPDIDTDTETVPLKITVPPTMGEASEALATWGRYMTETLRKPWGPIQAEALMMGYHGRTSELTRDIAHSMAAGWRTVKPAPPENETFQKKELKRPILTQHEKNMLVLQKNLEGEQNE